MPVYEYRCISCEEVFTEVRKVKDRHEPACLECPLCGMNEDFNRIMFTPSFTPFETLRDKGVFETPARHRTDYRGK